MRKIHKQLRRGFTLPEIMCSLMIFATVATAGTYLMGAMANNETYFRDGTNSQSEVEFALGRIVENVRAATAVSSPSSATAVHSITLTNINGQTVTYQINSSGNLTETVGSTTSTLVHSASFSAAQTGSNAKAFTITLSSGTEQVISRSVTVFGRNL
ncbi:MAG TPA: type II secretion system protein [Tepidisphaeraceae bacterium]|jgi:prepilin-type N-terminal cleavage/methylation domain-containing protein